MALLIDTRELARTARTLEGTLDVAAMPRLASLLAREAGQVHWRARGDRRERPDGGHDDLLRLELSAELHMACVRCLADAPIALQVANVFRLVASDEQAEREDLEDSEFDVLAGGARFDLGDLIEDEAIMGLPSLPRHEHCEFPDGAEQAQSRAHPDGKSESAAAAANGRTAGEPPAGTDDRPAPGGQGQSGERIRPFADLAELMKRRH